jgi:hypothetical protein
MIKTAAYKKIYLLATACFLTANLFSQMLFSDSFNGPSLNPNWIIINPNPASLVQLNGFDELSLKASASNGGSDLYSGTNFKGPRIVQPLDTSKHNWMIETKLRFAPSNDYQGAGFIFYTKPSLADSSAIVRGMERKFFPTQGGQALSWLSSDPSNKLFIPYTDSICYLRCQRNSDSLRYYYSQDGTSWIFGGSQVALQIFYVGIFCIRLPADNITTVDSYANFDYFTATTYPNNNALLFDGINDRVEIANDSLLSPSSITLQAWVREDELSGWPWRCVVTKRNCCGNAAEQWTMQTEGIGLMSFHAITDGTQGPFVTDTVQLKQGEWTQFTATYDGHAAILYRNGVPVASQTNCNGNIVPKSFPVVIGDRDGGLDFWPGAIDEIRIWDRALTQKEILSNMNCRLNGTEQGLIAYYDFNQGIPNGINTGVTTLPDLTIHGFNGSLQHFGLSGNTSNWTSSGFTDFQVSINGQPADTTIDVGHSAQFSVSSIYQVSYQWQTDSAGTGYKNIINGGQYAGATTNTLLVSSATSSNNNQIFRCIVSSLGSCSDTSAKAVLYVTRPAGVELLQFTAIKENKTALLLWTIQKETGIVSYGVERSPDGINFTPIGNLPALNINNYYSYKFVDDKPFTMVNFYRIKVIELNSNFFYSAIKQISFDSNLPIRIYPNPSAGKFTVEFGQSFNSNYKTIVIHNVLGQMITRLRTNQKTVEVNLAGTAQSGVYFIEILNDPNERVALFKAVIVH